ncbi:MAG: tRNA lysidine(34) synthetase TilS [Chloroflexota bacterium]
MTIQARTGWFQGDCPVVVGVSGGPDSLCLVHLLYTSGIPITVAHVNHKLRPEADDEAEMVRSLAASWGVPFVSGTFDVAQFADRNSLSLEEAARKVRYQFLFEHARQAKACAVAVAHTADDQVETMLMHLLGGAGLRGLKGMGECTVLPEFDSKIPLVRPILHVWRSEVEAYCRNHGLQPAQDLTNQDTTFLRNRLRHILIPELESYNPRIKEVLFRSAESLRGDHDLLEDVISAYWTRIDPEQGQGYICFHRPSLETLSIPVRRNLIRRAAFLLRPMLRDMDFKTLDEAAHFSGKSRMSQADFTGGLYLFHEGDKLYLAMREADLPNPGWPQVGVASTLSRGRNILPGGWFLDVEELAGEHLLELAEKADPYTAWLDADSLGNDIVVRTRRAGERFQPLGMDGKSISLQDFFVNEKLPRRARTHWPLVVAESQIAWVPGFRIGHPFRVIPGTRRVSRLSLVHEMGST